MKSFVLKWTYALHIKSVCAFITCVYFCAQLLSMPLGDLLWSVALWSRHRNSHGYWICRSITDLASDKKKKLKKGYTLHGKKESQCFIRHISTPYIGMFYHLLYSKGTTYSSKHKCHHLMHHTRFWLELESPLAGQNRESTITNSTGQRQNTKIHKNDTHMTRNSKAHTEDDYKCIYVHGGSDWDHEMQSKDSE